MAKINYKSILLAARTESKNFSELPNPAGGGTDGVHDRQQNEQFDIGDDNHFIEQIDSNIQADMLLLELLHHLNDRQKIILLYQILREAGYNLNHADCAKTLSLTREHYMFLLKKMKERSAKVLQDRQA
jgi:hypothetical protein